MRRLVTAAAVLAALFILMTAAPVDADGDDGAILIDYGNGVTDWYGQAEGTYLDAARSVLDSAGVEYETDGAWFISIGGMSNHSVGSQECTWRLYTWSDGEWEESADYASDAGGSSFAVAFYPDGTIVPAETPDERTAWVSHYGDSSQSNVSDSYGPEQAATPLEWYRTYSTGYVDSSIVVAGQYLYHTTGGTYGGSGSDRFPWVYCLDRYTGDEVWSYMMTYGAGYEVTTPLIVGDMLVVTSTSGDIYLFDRYTGDVYDRLTLELSYPLDENGDVVWDGRTFYTGATTPVYDSGAIYFGTSDGRIMAYGIRTEGDGDSRTSVFVELWTYTPPSDTVGGEYAGTRGCFYYHAPVIADTDGTRVLYLGNYEGYLFALDASAGKEIWAERVIDLREDNPGENKGTPGSVSGISVTDDGRLIVLCTDGSMSPVYGMIACIDAATGTHTYWSHVVLAGYVTLDDDGFYTCITPSYGGDTEIGTADGSVMAVESGLFKLDYDGNVVWFTAIPQTIKAGITHADGRLYIVDYSSGEMYPNGGGIAVYSDEDGSQIWKIRLEPFTDESYNMVSATVIDGKVYVANDYGAVYCVSEVQGTSWNDSGEIILDSPGFRDWSWILLAVIFIAAIVLLYRYYRR